ncbi:MAG TPA: HAD-IA family hydrolase [Pyrinomonadaceae bacterium]|nr:HAD-IA family hydrolase [Pyrinomonadaceae bacterium]
MVTRDGHAKILDFGLAKLIERPYGLSSRTVEDRMTSMHPALQDLAAVIFDVGGTLVHPDWQRLGKIVEAETGLLFTPKQMHEAFYAMLQTANAELVAEVNSKRRSGAYWTLLETFRLLGIDEGACISIRRHLNRSHQERHLWCQADSEAASVLFRLKSEGLRLAVISNTEDGRVNESLALADLASHFEFLIDSYLVGLSKPDAAIFQLALDRLGLDPREAAYVGDSYGYDVIGAQRAGLRPIFLDRAGAYDAVEFARIRSLRELILYDAVAQ